MVKNSFKLIVALALFFTLFNGVTYDTHATNQKKIQIYKENIVFSINGSEYQSPAHQQSFIYESRTYVSIRFAGHMLQKWVDWDDATKTVIITEPNKEQLLELKQKQTEYLLSENEKIDTKGQRQTASVVLNYAKLDINGKMQDIPSDVTTILHNGSVYIPLRYSGELFNNLVDYDPISRKVIMNSAEYVAEQTKKQKETTKSDDQPTITTPGIVTPPGNGDVTNKPSRDSLVDNTKSELTSLKEYYSSRLLGIYLKYTETTDEAEKQKLKAQGQSIIAEADSKVADKINALNQDLTNNKYSIGDDSVKMMEEYEALKAAMYSSIQN